MTARVAQAPRHAVWRTASIVVTLVVCWQLAVQLRLLDPLLFPAPSAVVRALRDLGASGLLPLHLAATASRLLTGLLLGGGVGLLAGVVLGAHLPTRRVAEPFVAGLHPVPKIAIFPLLIAVLGIGEPSAIAVIALATFFPMVINTMAGVCAILPEHRQVARNYGATRAMTVRRVLMPAAVPFVLAGLRIAMNVAFQTAVSVEIVSAKTGLGALLWLSWQTFRMPDLYAALAVIVLGGLGMSAALGRIQRSVAPWQPAAERTA